MIKPYDEFQDDQLKVHDLLMRGKHANSELIKSACAHFNASRISEVYEGGVIKGVIIYVWNRTGKDLGF